MNRHLVLVQLMIGLLKTHLLEIFKFLNVQFVFYVGGRASFTAYFLSILEQTSNIYYF